MRRRYLTLFFAISRSIYCSEISNFLPVCSLIREPSNTCPSRLLQQDKLYSLRHQHKRSFNTVHCENKDTKSDSTEAVHSPKMDAQEQDTKEEVETTPKEEEKALPKLSSQDYRIYNSMADHMELYHNNFRQTWKVLHGASTSGVRPPGLSVAGFIRAGEQFCHHLTIHHTIEEQHIFPVLATRMPAFQVDLIDQHKEIHNGIEKLEGYLAACRSGERELRLAEVNDILNSFGDVLWAHLDDEVRQLGAENMRKFWSLADMRRMPM